MVGHATTILSTFLANCRRQTVRWPRVVARDPDLGDEELLEKLLALNLARAGG